MKWLAIINPHADHHTPEQWRHLDREVRRQLGADCVWTSYPRHASAIVRKHPSYDGFIAVGGDGTIAEVVNGLDSDRHRLGVIPAGTGNGLARDLQLRSEGDALRALRRPRFDRLDLISVHFRTRQAESQRWMVNTSALGYIAGTTELGALPFKRLGRWLNALTPLVQCCRQKEFAARLRLDDGPWQELCLTSFVIQNTPHIGQFRLFPEAHYADGMMDLLYGRLARVRQLLENAEVLTRTTVFQRSVRRQARRVEVELPRPGMLMIDGDLIFGVEAIRYEVEPQKLWCCTG